MRWEGWVDEDGEGETEGGGGLGDGDGAGCGEPPEEQAASSSIAASALLTATSLRPARTGRQQARSRSIRFSHGVSLAAELHV